MPSREEQRASDLAWLSGASVGDEVAVTNTYLTGANPYSHILSNFSGTNVRLATDDNERVAGAVREFCTITTIRAIIPDGFVVDNSVYDKEGKQQTEKPVERDGMIPDDCQLKKDLAITCPDCNHPNRSKFQQKETQMGELCEPTQELRDLAAKLRFNEEVKRINFRNFSADKVYQLIGSINEEFDQAASDATKAKSLWE